MSTQRPWREPTERLTKEQSSPECIRLLPPELACTSRSNQRAGEEAQDQEQSRGHGEDCGVESVRGCSTKMNGHLNAEAMAWTHKEVHGTLNHALQLRLDGLLRYKLNGRIELALYFAEIWADARAVAARGLKAPLRNTKLNVDISTQRPWRGLTERWMEPSQSQRPSSACRPATALSYRYTSAPVFQRR